MYSVLYSRVLMSSEGSIPDVNERKEEDALLVSVSPLSAVNPFRLQHFPARN